MYSEKIVSKNIKFIVNGKEYVYKYSDLGFSVNKEKLKNDILKYQSDLNYLEKTNILKKKSKKVFSFEFIYDKNTITDFVNKLKGQVDVSVTNGYFAVNDKREVSYVLGNDSFSLDVDKSVSEIVNNINKNDTINLVGYNLEKAINNDNYKLVDTKVSSFSTEFDPYISRAKNLQTALAYIDGGLDATVASYAGGWHVDFQFKNTYKYPIYVSAYSVGGTAHVDFWSNSNAKEGKTYTTGSVKMGNRYYKTYLHTFQNGVEVDKSLIASTWYTEE